MGANCSNLSKKDIAKLTHDFKWKEWTEAEPGSLDQDAYDNVLVLSSKKYKILENLRNYKPSTAYLREAISSRTPEAEESAFMMVNASARIVQEFYLFSKEMQTIAQDILLALTPKASDRRSSVSGRRDSLSMLSRAAITYRLAELFDFALRFDRMKMLEPGLQNDFSFYRRSLHKESMQHLQPAVGDDDASFISLFLAGHIPMLTVLCTAAKEAYRQDPSVTDNVARFCNQCYFVLRNKVLIQKEVDSEAVDMLLHAMVGALILYDHVEPEGVFQKRSPVSSKLICQLLATDFFEKVSEMFGQKQRNRIAQECRALLNHPCDGPVDACGGDKCAGIVN
eukprot:917852_1